MREFINIIQNLSEAAKPAPENDTEDTGDEATSTAGVKAKGLFPDELKKRENFALFINKINNLRKYSTFVTILHTTIFGLNIHNYTRMI